MRTAEPAPPPPAAVSPPPPEAVPPPPPEAVVPPPASALPPGAVPVPAVLAPTPPPAAGLHVVEQRAVGTEVKVSYDDDPDSGPQRLLEALPAAMLEGVKLPLTYTLAASASRSGATVRVADSEPARAQWYACGPFYKPISRCVGGRE